MISLVIASGCADICNTVVQHQILRACGSARLTDGCSSSPCFSMLSLVIASDCAQNFNTVVQNRMLQVWTCDCHHSLVFVIAAFVSMISLSSLLYVLAFAIQLRNIACCWYGRALVSSTVACCRCVSDGIACYRFCLRSDCAHTCNTVVQTRMWPVCDCCLYFIRVLVITVLFDDIACYRF